METTVPPVNVSPLIKTMRWGLLIAGILYGRSRFNYLYKKELIKHEEFEKNRPEREAKAALEKEKQTKEQIEILSKQIGIKF